MTQTPQGLGMTQTPRRRRTGCAPSPSHSESFRPAHSVRVTPSHPPPLSLAAGSLAQSLAGVEGGLVSPLRVIPFESFRVIPSESFRVIPSHSESFLVIPSRSESFRVVPSYSA